MRRLPEILPLMFVAMTAAALGATLGASEEQKLGKHFEINPQALPAPRSTPSSSNSSEIIARAPGQAPLVPAGFHAALFAEGLEHARWLAVAENGDVFLAEPDADKVTLLRDANGDGRAEMKTTFAGGFTRPHGLAFHDGALYVADTEAVWRIPYKAGDTKAAARTRVTVDSFGGGGHWTRDIAFDSKGRLYLAIGSANNVAEDRPPRATVQLVEKGRLRTFAAGLRNPVGIAVYPGSDTVFVTVNERDNLGDGLVPDYLTHVVEGGFYGWPYAYIGHHPDPDFGRKRPDLVAKTITPDLLFEAHSAPLGLVFYEGKQFPASYRGDAFVALHGSWNAARPLGYKIVHVRFRDGRLAGGYDNFAVGFWKQEEPARTSVARGVTNALGLTSANAQPAKVWGRPAGLAVAKDGSLLVADDVGNAVWRIAYTGR